MWYGATDSMSPEALREWVDALTSLFSSNAPWVWWLADAFLFVAAVWAMVRMVLDLWSKLREPFTQIRTLFFNSDRNQRTVERRRFAGHLEDRLKSLNERESWDDNRFAELEAEVEAPEREGPFAWLPKRRMPRVRRQRLSRALEQSRARLILLQGEPGSGKSVALRHVALTMARRTQTDVSKLPVYVNLKLLRPKTGQSIDRNLIADFVRRELGGPNTDIHGYVEREFEAGLKNGRWVFLFDSFDELPDVLASTDADEVVASYAKAIYEFLHGMNRCRGIIASRLFRGPKSLPWTEFRVAPLDRARRLELIDRANLTQKDRQALVLWMDGPEAPERELSNPMFVGLLCAQVKSGSAVPQSAHRVYEDYVARLFKRDAKRLGEGFGVEVASLRRFAEQVAFYMTAEGMGLEPDLVAPLRGDDGAPKHGHSRCHEQSARARLYEAGQSRRERWSTNFHVLASSLSGVLCYLHLVARARARRSPHASYKRVLARVDGRLVANERPKYSHLTTVGSPSDPRRLCRPRP